MREQYDAVEDIRIKKDNNELSKYIVKVIVSFLVFIFFCVMSFTTIYFLVLEKINSNPSSSIDNNSTRKAFNVEMKLRKDIEKMTQKKTK
jgi:hypothetical protein